MRKRTTKSYRPPLVTSSALDSKPSTETVEGVHHRLLNNEYKLSVYNDVLSKTHLQNVEGKVSIDLFKTKMYGKIGKLKRLLKELQYEKKKQNPVC